MDRFTGKWPGKSLTAMDHPNFNPITGHIDGTPLFGRGVWHSPKWGSRYLDTELGGLLSIIDRWVRLVGNYISKRTGQDMPLWSSKDFFMRNFGWIRNHPDVVSNKYKGRIGPHLSDALGRLKTKWSYDLTASLKEREALWSLVRLFEETTSVLVVSLTLTFTISVVLYKKVCALGIFNSSVFVYPTKIKNFIAMVTIFLKKAVILAIKLYLLATLLFIHYVIISIGFFINFGFLKY